MFLCFRGFLRNNEKNHYHAKETHVFTLQLNRFQGVQRIICLKASETTNWKHLMNNQTHASPIMEVVPMYVE
jgi:hypothetical protein